MSNVMAGLKMRSVTVYTAPGCAYCLFVESFLKRNSIPFKEIDISKNKAAKEQMIRVSGQENVPVVEIGDVVIVGYDLRKMKDALGVE